MADNIPLLDANTSDALRNYILASRQIGDGITNFGTTLLDKGQKQDALMQDKAKSLMDLQKWGMDFKTQVGNDGNIYKLYNSGDIANTGIKNYEKPDTPVIKEGSDGYYHSINPSTGVTSVIKGVGVPQKKTLLEELGYGLGAGNGGKNQTVGTTPKITAPAQSSKMATTQQPKPQAIAQDVNSTDYLLSNNLKENKPITTVDIASKQYERESNDVYGNTWAYNPITKRTSLVKRPVLDNKDVNSLNEAINTKNNIDYVIENFNPSYTGVVDSNLNSLKDTFNIPDLERDKRSAWESKLQTVINAARNQTFGAALSKFDIGEFAKEMPSTSAGDDTVVPRLKSRKEILDNALSNTYSLWVNKYGKDVADSYFSKLSHGGIMQNTDDKANNMVELKRRGLR